MKCLHLGMSQHFYRLRHGILGLWDVGIHPQHVVCLGGTAKGGLKQYTNNNLVDKNCHWWMNYYHCSHYDYYMICSLRSIGKTWFPGRFIRLQNTQWPTLKSPSFRDGKLRKWPGGAAMKSGPVTQGMMHPERAKVFTVTKHALNGQNSQGHREG